MEGLLSTGPTLSSFVKNTHHKAANFTFGLILPVAMIPEWFLGGKYMKKLDGVDSVDNRHSNDKLHHFVQKRKRKKKKKKSDM